MRFEIYYFVIIPKALIVVTTWVYEIHLEITLDTGFLAKNQWARIHLKVLSHYVFATRWFTNGGTRCILGGYKGLWFIIHQRIARLLIAENFAFVWALLREEVLRLVVKCLIGELSGLQRFFFRIIVEKGRLWIEILGLVLCWLYTLVLALIELCKPMWVRESLNITPIF